MNWQKKTLGDLVENFSIRAKDYGGSEGMQFLGVSNDDGIVNSKSAAEEKGEDYKIIEKGCFAYNPYRINVGSVAYFNNDIKGLISPAYVIFKTKPNSIKDDLLLKFLKSTEGLRQIKFHGRGTVRQALRFDDLCKIEIVIPSFDDQELLITNIQKIEAMVDRLSSEVNHQLNLVKKLRQQLLQNAIQGKLVKQNPNDEPANILLQKIKAEKELLIKDRKLQKEKALPQIKEEDIPFDIPENWVWCRFGEIVNMSRGRFSVRPRNDPDYFGGEYPFIQIGSLNDWGSTIEDAPQSLNAKGYKVSKEFPTSTIAIAIVGGTIGNLGVLGKPMCFPDSIIGILPTSHLDHNFILNFMRFVQPTIRKASYQMAGQPNIKIPTLTDLMVPLPPLAEQRRIGENFEQLMQTCDALETSIKQSQQYNEQLLQQVIREALTKEIKPGVLV